MGLGYHGRRGALLTDPLIDSYKPRFGVLIKKGSIAQSLAAMDPRLVIDDRG